MPLKGFIWIEAAKIRSNYTTSINGLYCIFYHKVHEDVWWGFSLCLAFTFIPRTAGSNPLCVDFIMS